MCKLNRFIAGALEPYEDTLSCAFRESQIDLECFGSFREELNPASAPSDEKFRYQCLDKVQGSVLAMPNEHPGDFGVETILLTVIGSDEYLVSKTIFDEETATKFFRNNTRWINPLCYAVNLDMVEGAFLTINAIVVRAYDDEGFVVGLLEKPIVIESGQIIAYDS